MEEQSCLVLPSLAGLAKVRMSLSDQTNQQGLPPGQLGAGPEICPVEPWITWLILL